MSQVVDDGSLDLFEVFEAVGILHVGGSDVQLEIGSIVLGRVSHVTATAFQRTYFVVFIVRQRPGQVLADENTSLICPSTGDVTHGVATTAKNKGGQPKALDVSDAVGMALHAEVEATQSVSTETVTSALQNDSLGLVELHDVFDNGFENRLVRVVVDTIAEGEVDGVVLAGTDADVAQLTSTREVFAVLVEGDGHDTVGRIEGLLDTISVVDVNIDVEDALLESKEFEDTEDNVCRLLAGGRRGHDRVVLCTVDVTETTGFALLGVVEATSPVDGDVALLAVEAGGALHAATGADATEFEEAVKDGTVVSDVVFALLLLIGVHVVGCDLLQEVDVLVRVELGHFTPSRRLCALQMTS